MALEFSNDFLKLFTILYCAVTKKNQVGPTPPCSRTKSHFQCSQGQLNKTLAGSGNWGPILSVLGVLLTGKCLVAWQLRCLHSLHLTQRMREVLQCDYELWTGKFSHLIVGMQLTAKEEFIPGKKWFKWGFSAGFLCEVTDRKPQLLESSSDSSHCSFILRGSGTW